MANKAGGGKAEPVNPATEQFLRPPHDIVLYCMNVHE